ncbi:MAG TPA: nickel-dependent lactate racemase [Candidatus Margulisiibacteriota bacterium]|nr:nickel-dependent lactate racemase [Candidatus Margulisiibacteriota bacterium]
MDLQLDYGRPGLTISVPDALAVSVVNPSKGEPLADPTAAVEQALRQPIGARPLHEIARGRRDAVVVISDKTRPVPNGIVLPPILRTLEAAGIARERIEILVATGLHRANTHDELVEMTSAAIVERYPFRNHIARDADAHVHLGRTTRGTEIWLDRGFMAADLKIVTGLIEPHLMAGYSGGRKGVAPGLAGVETMRSAHGPRMLEDNVGPGIVDGNPFHEDLLEIARLAGVDFLVDVSIDRARRLTGVFAGHIERAHEAGMQAVEREVRVDLPAAADVVITSAGGYPLDQTFYQSIKGLTGALNIVRCGGTIILAAALTEGIGSQDFQDLLRGARGNDAFMAQITSPGFFRIDQWMVQHLCQVLRKANVTVVTDGLVPEVVRTLLVTPAPTVEAALADALARHAAAAHVAVLPQGPYVLATVRGRKLALGRAWMADAA